MNAPFLWIVLPLVISGFLLLLRNERAVTLIGAGITLFLSLFALIVPIDEALLIGPLSFKLSGTLQVLGRSFVFTSADGSMLGILYGLATLWFFGAESLGFARRLIPLGLAILSLLVASIAVQPFLYAALLIEIAILLMVPLLQPLDQTPGRGVTRFIIYQTLAMPFILFSGWLLAGVETSPGDVTLTTQATAMLVMGFAFLLAIFPLYTWIPMLFEETPAYIVGYLMWLLPQATFLFLMSFFDRYTFLRGSPDLLGAVRNAGLLMVVTSGIWAAFQRHLGRLMGYAVIAETGFMLISLGLGTANGIGIIFLQIIPRGLGLAVWALSLSVIEGQVQPPTFSNVQGAARAVPFAAVGLILASLSVAGFPLLAGFPVRLALTEGLAALSSAQSLLLMFGLLGLLVGAVRTIAVSVMAPANTPWEQRETRPQAILIGLGLAALILIGLFPQIMQPLLRNLSALFERLGH
jgi:multicomponent Na+:H+ antiporter subunit D